MKRHVLSLILAGVFGGTFLSLGANLAAADPPPPPPPPGLPSPGWYSGWDEFFPKCWPPWEPPGEPAPPQGDPRLDIWTQVPYAPCPPPPSPPPGQPYPPLPQPPLANPWCGPADIRPSACFPGEGFYSRVLPPGYYGPPSWYPSIGVPFWMPPG